VESTTSRSAAHRQTGYIAEPPLDSPESLPLPPLTADLSQAKEDVRVTGVCRLTGVLSSDELEALRAKLDRQAAAERALGELAPEGSQGTKQLVMNMVNKGQVFRDLIVRPEVDAFAGMLLGKDFLLSSITGGSHYGSTSEAQVLHRDQGQVPASIGMPAACQIFWLLDDFTPARGGTWLVPGSHRWPAIHQIKPPDREAAVQVEAPAGSLVVWDARIWHSAGANPEGHPRRHISTFFCLPWMRPQENWGISCLQEVLDEASPTLKVRLGLKTYGTLGQVNGTATGQDNISLGSDPVIFPDYIIGEDASLHPLRRVSRAVVSEG